MLTFDKVTIEAAHYSWWGRRQWRPLLTDISLQQALTLAASPHTNP